MAFQGSGVQSPLSPYKVILAPMCGVTDYPYRTIARRYGAKYLVSEMTVSDALVRRNEFRERTYDDNTTVQIAGNNEYIMSEAAKILEGNGAKYIDINMGCPAKKIAINSYAGAALLKDPQLAINIFRAVKSSVSIPVSIKMRIGWNEMEIIPLIKALCNENISEITIHGRTRNQLYNGKANWDHIYDVKHHSTIPIIGNGDIKSIYDAKEKIQCLDGVMIGRGAYGKPWLIHQIDKYINENIIINDPPIDKQKAILLEHIDLTLSFYGIAKGILLLRKHIGWYTKSIRNSSRFRVAINQSTNLEQVIHLINHIYDDIE